MKSIETHARAFLPLNISAIGTVLKVLEMLLPLKPYYKVPFFLFN